MKKKFDKEKLNKNLNEKLARMIVVMSIIAIMFSFSFQFTISGSMEPTFEIGSLQISRLYNFNVKRGDVIGFVYPYEYGLDQKVLGKRVIGMPGETIQINKDGVFINGKLLDEPYVKQDTSYKNIDATFEIPEDSYFVMGDSRNTSVDSRYLPYPFVKKEWIIKKAYAQFKDKKIMPIKAEY